MLCLGIRCFQAEKGVLPSEPGIASSRVPTVTCKSPVRPKGTEAKHGACGSRGGDVRFAILGTGNGNRNPLSVLGPGVVTWVGQKGWYFVAQATVKWLKLPGRLS